MNTGRTRDIISASPNTIDCALFNGGSIRIDDVVSGKITQLDVLRILPFGGKVIAVKMKGRLLERILETGLTNKGSGGYLQWEKISYDEAKKEWKINGKWTAPVSVANGIQNDTLRYPTWNPVLYQVPGGELLLFYKVGPKPSDWKGWMKSSKDNGITWSDAKALPEGIIGPVKNNQFL